MSYRASFALAVVLTAACGDGGGSSADAPVTAADATAADAPATCDPTGYPPEVRVQSVDLMQPHGLTLDGAGARCEQLIRALTDPTGRPPELALLDAAGVTGTCSFDDLLMRDIVRLRFPEYAGLPVYWPVQDVLAHVDQANSVVFLHGDFLPAGAAPAPGCLDGAAAAALVPGRALDYERFAACLPQGPGSYPIVAGDVIEVIGEGFFLDGDGGLRRVHAIDVFLDPGNITNETRNSDLFCCAGPTEERCVGKRVFLDTYSGDTVGSEPHCHTC